MQKFKGIIFDFNGTLFWDEAFHAIAWQKFWEKYNINLSEKEKFLIHGKTNADIFCQLFPGCSKDEILAYTREKELMYRNICKAQKMVLAAGATIMLDFLKQHKVPITIATSSEIENVRFFIENFALHQWFDLDKIVFDDGSIKGKPHPDCYLKAAKNLNLLPDECIVFEDAYSGLKAATQAKIGFIIQVNSSNNPILLKQTDIRIDAVIHHFGEFNPTQLLIISA